MNHPFPFVYKLAAVSVGHAFLVFFIWIGVIHYNSYYGFLPVFNEIWISLAWLWLIWPLVLMNHGKHPPSFVYKCLAAASVGHAFLVFLIWIGHIYYDYSPLSAITWASFACLWLAWPLVLVIHPRKSPIYLAGSLILGIAMLLPCATTIYAFIVWTLYGFVTLPLTFASHDEVDALACASRCLCQL
jgi:hypothetical protein